MGIISQLFRSESRRCADLRERLVGYRLQSDRNIHALGPPLLATDEEPEDALLAALKQCRAALRSTRSYAAAVTRVREALVPTPPVPWPLSFDRLLWLWLSERFPQGPHLSARFFDLVIRPYCEELDLDLQLVESVMGMNLEHQTDSVEESVDPFDHLPALHRYLTERGFRASLDQQASWVFQRDADVLIVRTYPERVLLTTRFQLAQGIADDPSRLDPVVACLNGELLTKLRFHVDGRFAHLEFIVPRRLAASDPTRVIETWNAERLAMLEVGEALRASLL